MTTPLLSLTATTPRATALALGMAVVGALAAAGVWSSKAQGPTPPRAPDVQRGEYLVTRVGMCHDCHTQRGPDGALLMDRWLHGPSLPFEPTVPMPWAPAAPRIAGLPGYTDDLAVRFLTTGVTASGGHARPPMPEFRFNEEDARDVTAYLRSLGTH